MPLYRVGRTFVAIVEADDYQDAARAHFRPDWDAESSVIWTVADIGDVPRDWREVPPIRPDGKDAGTTTVRELLTPGAKGGR